MQNEIHFCIHSVLHKQLIILDTMHDNDKSVDKSYII